MGRATTWFLAFSLILVSCTAGSNPGETTTSRPSTTSSTSPSPTDPGRIVVLDDEGNVVVLDPDGSNRVPVTDDAGAAAVYTQPIWSPDATGLAFGRVTPEGFSVAIHDLSVSETRTIPTRNLPFYMYFSPQGDRLGVLHNGTSGVDFNLVDVTAGTIETIDNGAPFYFSWSPQDDLLVAHVGEDGVETIDSAGNRTALEPTGPQYLAPQWTDRGVFHVVDDSVVIESPNGDRAPAADVNGIAMFVANSQGTRVAVQTTGRFGEGVEVALADPPTIPSGQVVVVDLDSGTTETVSQDLALGFFWSPDGDKLLTLTTGESSIVPRVRFADGSTSDYPGYLPPNSMLQDTFPFFPQYAQSVRFWAPDSSAFAYAGSIDDRAGIWVQTVNGGTPERVADGRWVAWSSPRE